VPVKFIVALLHITKVIAVVINRLRIGHSRLAHSYLLSDDDVPLCETCGLPLTVKHILVECPSLQDICEKYFMVSCVKELCDSVDNQSIIGFITGTHFIVSYDVCYLGFILS